MAKRGAAVGAARKGGGTAKRRLKAEEVANALVEKTARGIL